MATISLHSPICIPGRTLRTPIAAVLRTPHFTFLLATASLPGLAVPFYHALPSRQNTRGPHPFVLPPPIAYKNCHVSASPLRFLGGCNRHLSGRMALGAFVHWCRGDPPVHRIHRYRDLSFSQKDNGTHSFLLRRICGCLCCSHI